MHTLVYRAGRDGAIWEIVAVGSPQGLLSGLDFAQNGITVCRVYRPNELRVLEPVVAEMTSATVRRGRPLSAQVWLRKLIRLRERAAFQSAIEALIDGSRVASETIHATGN